MKSLKNLALLLTVLLFASCASSVKVNSKYQESTDFQGLSSFEIVEPTNLSEKVSTKYKMQIENAIRQEMKGQRYREVIESPSLSVNYFVIVNTVQDTESYVSYYGTRRWGTATIHNNVYEYKKGTIIIDLIDKDKKEVIWHGVASGTLDNDLDNADEKINEAVKAIFDKYSKDRTKVNS